MTPDNDPILMQMEIIRYENGEAAAKIDTVLKEARLLIDINGVSSHQLICTKSSVKSFIVGYLFSQGLINDYSDIQEIRLNQVYDLAYVKIADAGKPQGGTVGSTDCIKHGFSTRGVTELDYFCNYPSVDSGFNIPAQQVLEMVSEFNKKSELFISTGGVHSCALCGLQGILCFEEDISRHNALDKIIGYAIINQIPLKACYILTSGRVPSDMIAKIIKAGVPIVVSRSAPTDFAVNLAKKYNITLVGFARGKRMNIYSASERILL